MACPFVGEYLFPTHRKEELIVKEDLMSVIVLFARFPLTLFSSLHLLALVSENPRFLSISRRLEYS